MIQCLHHTAMIVSSEKSVDFYKSLGFVEENRICRGYDVVVWLSGYGMTLELFVDGNHPARVTNPEAMGLRHIAFSVDNIEKTAEEFCLSVEPIREKDGVRFTFFKDPDGQPIELREKVCILP